MFARLLIDNRGEIAVRIARTAAESGLSSVAVYAQDEAEASHVAKADDAVPLRGFGAAAYVDIDDVLRAAERAGAEAIHPGYGFLSESAEFARRCAQHGVTFVGPHPETLEAFGDKIRSRALAREAGLPVLAGSEGPVTLDEALDF